MNLIDQLAKGDPLKYNSVFLLPNSIVFVKRMMNADNRKYNINYARVVRENSKQP